MNMSVGDLRAALAQLDANLEVLIGFGGAFVPVIGVTAGAGISFAVVRGKNKGELPKRFSTDEDGLIGHLSRLGMNDHGISDILGRTQEAVTRRRKALGFDPGTKQP